MGPETGTRRQGRLAAWVAAVLFVAAWLPWHPSRAPLPTADLYTHLTVARHLVRGDGFLNDVTYPLSFAFPFARELPQPLITRQPGYAVLLTAPYFTAGRDPVRTLAHVRGLQVLLLGLIALAGVRGLQRAGRPLGIVPWFVLLGGSTLLAFAVDWGFDELPAALALLLIWLDNRRTWHRGPSLGAGALAGALALIRLDLLWVAPLWWLLTPRGPAGPGGREPDGEPSVSARSRWRRLALATAVTVAVLSPWLVRNARLTGNPVFTLQSQAELVKDTRTWPGYAVYRNLTPQPMGAALTRDPVPILRKAVRGLRFFGEDLPRFFPPLLLAAFAAIMVHVAWRRRQRGRWPGRDRSAPAVAALTLLLLCVQYAFFDHSLRHLLVVLPILAWETACASGVRWHWALLAALTIVLPLGRLPGWDNAAREAAAAERNRPWENAAGLGAADGIYFFEYSAGPWFLDRPGVWRSPAAEAQVPQLLGRQSTDQSPPSDRPEDRP